MREQLSGSHRQTTRRRWRPHGPRPLDGPAPHAAGDATPTPNRLASLVANLPAVLYINATDDAGTALYVSPHYERMLGYSTEDRLADPDLWHKLLHPSDRDWVIAEAKRAEIAGEPFRVEYRLIARDGRTVWVREEGRLVRDPDGSGQYWQGVLLDITDRKQVEQALAESEERFRSLFEHAAAGQAVADADGRFLTVNPAFCRMLGRANDELVGALIADVTHPDDIAPTAENMDRLLRGIGDAYTMEKRYLRPDGTVVHALTSTSVLRDELGNVKHFVALIQDLTERKRAERALERSNDLLKRVDDQRRALLTSLVSAQEVARDRVATAIHDDPIQKVTAAAARLEILAQARPELVEDAQFAKAQTAVRGAMEGLRHLMFELHPQALDTDGLEAAIRLFVAERFDLPDAPVVRIESRLAVEPAKDVRLVLYRIVQEALTNVLKHARASAVTVLVCEREQDYLIRVADDGAGATLGDGGRSPAGHLGLTSMRERAELAGGGFSISTASGVGTTVEAWVPRL